MKQKEYVALLNRIQELVYEVNSITQHTYDSEYASDRYGKELAEKKKELATLTERLEEILTVDSKTFNEAFMKYLHDDNYELVEVKLEGNTIHVAKPKDMKLESGTSLLKDGVYILSVDDTKVLSKPACKVGAGYLPVVSILNKAFKNIYFSEFSKYNKRYDRFASFMGGAEATSVKRFDSKKNNRR